MTFAHLDDVLAEVKPLGQLFAAASYRLFLVGGIVRDQWLDATLDASSDIDLTTNAHPAEIKRIVAPYAEDLWTQGEKFGTIGLRTDGRDYEITTHRAESYSSESRKPVVSFGDDIDVDLSRRDFTVNAMAIELPDGYVVDPYGGAQDLAAKLLRTPLSADVSFTDDPLRMLRAARFAARFSLTPDPEVITSAERLHQRIRIVAIERIGVELRRLLGLERTKVGLDFLSETGLLAEVLSYGQPELIAQAQPRLASAIEVAAQLPADWQLRLAGIGVHVFDTVDGVLAMCRRLRLSNDNERRIVRLSRSALELLHVPNLNDATLRRWVHVCNDEADAIMLASVLADDPLHVSGFVDALRSLQDRDQGTDMQYLGGDAIMSLLGVAPGRVIGQAQKFLRAQYFANGPLTSAQQETLLQSWWAEQPTASD